MLLASDPNDFLLSWNTSKWLLILPYQRAWNKVPTPFSLSANCSGLHRNLAILGVDLFLSVVIPETPPTYYIAILLITLANIEKGTGPTTSVG